MATVAQILITKKYLKPDNKLAYFDPQLYLANKFVTNNEHKVRNLETINKDLVISLNAWNYLKFRALRQHFRSVLPDLRAGSDTNRLQDLCSDGAVIFQALRRKLMRSGPSRPTSQ
ncbi:hypothetical protein GJ496_008540 [Pomphorhynchus laevis]|nr:hypothetical protein GJ496_008540 [Pomphorhynchus laevis]